MTAPFGFVNAFKPPGPSSAAFGSWVKHVAGGAVVGHWGTLDPAACGVLVLAIGKATRLLPLIGDARKQYVFQLVVGEQTDTGDASGRVVASAPVPEGWKGGLAAAAAALVGTQAQIPPMHSAVKVSGKPLYRRARAGLTIPRASRVTTVHQLRPLPSDHEAQIARLFVECDAGTYVRVLCEDLGRHLGLPARMGALLRVASGPFALRDSVVPELIKRDLSGCLIDPLRMLPNPRIELDASRAQRFSFGNEVRLEQDVAANSDMLVTHDGALLGVGHIVSRNQVTFLTPARVLSEA